MLQFNRLRLAGFKSFVDSTELHVEAGLTGIVGPNGCGKSNLVEALRWVMGESSAKQMRGGEMEDVIFSGTDSRPPRNVGEVILNLDNSARVAPAMFNDFDELDISRRIERGRGSTYRVNGREVRARDVQLLFADSATGARSTAIVSQGRIGSIIAAKPTERRTLLEEAAGITGLHSRRHEAELRLRGAETNLTRLDDILVTLEAQFASLKKQVRQASRYRNISGHIRRAEATLFLLRWRTAEAALEQGRAALAATEGRVAERTRRAAGAATRQSAAAAALPELRQAEAEAAAALARLVVERDGLEAEGARIETARDEAEARLTQADADSMRARALAADAEAALARLAEERAAIEAARDGEETGRAEAEERLAEARDRADALDLELGEIVAKAAADEARRADLGRRLDELGERRRRLGERAAEIEAQRADAAGEAVAAQDLAAAEADAGTAQAGLEAARTETEAAEEARIAAAEAAAGAMAEDHQAGAALARLEAEAKALSDILTAGETDLWPPLIDAVRVEAGYEVALGAALGDDLAMPADEAAPAHWRTLAPFDEAPALPAGAEPLSRMVEAPPTLARRLSQIGLVEDLDQGAALAPQLAQGQRLVSRDGALWRWDGFTVGSGAATAAAARLEQRNRLGAVGVELEAAQRRRDETAAGTAAAAATAEDTAAAEQRARLVLRQADTAQAEARDALARLKEGAAGHQSRLAALDDAAREVARDLDESETVATQAEAALAAAPQPGADGEAIDRRRAELADSRTVQVEHQSTVATLAGEAEARRRRAEEIGAETESWRARGEDAARHLDDLERRRAEVEAERLRLAALPDQIEARRHSVADAIGAAEETRRAVADRLAEAETRLGEADAEQRGAEADLAAGREERVRAEGAVEQADQACVALKERIADRLDCPPEDLAEAAELADDAETPDEDAVEKRLERLMRERDTMGPVNLRAEHEAAELRQQVEALEGERDDLIKAIGKLRHGIAQLNREGRSRLLASFAEVDRHFQELFVRLFGGGRAHLELTESDDPLEAGLEIMASPPGKRLQILSLLSGGERALAALALMFAVFLTNPAPICVLDEVDAPLDEANVDRFCSLVEELADAGANRFIIITHHRLTMARMDRLYGVTMTERGVSRLVSVDLTHADRLKATA